MNRLFRPEYIIKWYIYCLVKVILLHLTIRKKSKSIFQTHCQNLNHIIYLVYNEHFHEKNKALFQVNFPKPYCSVLWDLQFFFTYFGDPQLLLHNWLWWRPSAHTQYSQSSEFTHYKSHFGPKIDVSITVIYTKAAREEEEEACVCLVQCNL